MVMRAMPIHTASTSAGEPSDFAIDAVVKKIPERDGLSGNDRNSSRHPSWRCVLFITEIVLAGYTESVRHSSEEANASWMETHIHR